MEYKGDIKGFPYYIVNIMLDEQEKQGNKRDVSIFEKCKYSVKSDGGFDWSISTINEYTLNEVIDKRRFNLIKDPKKVDIYPKMMYVSDDSDEDALIDKYARVVFMEKKGVFMIWEGSETIKESENSLTSTHYAYAVDIPEELPDKMLTIDEIAKAFNVEVSQIKIVQ